jgi:hypothetical protein
LLEDSGFTDVEIGPAVDTFGGANGEERREPTRCTATPFSPANTDYT